MRTVSKSAVSFLLMMHFCSFGRSAQAQPVDRLHAVIQPGVEATTELGGTGQWGERVVIQVYYLSETSEGTIDIDLPKDASKKEKVAFLHGTPPYDVTVERCRIIDGIIQCRPLQKAPDVKKRDKLLQIILKPQRIDWKRTFFQLTIPAAAFELSDKEDGSKPRLSPEIKQKNLPLLKMNEEDYLSLRPFLHLSFSPLVRPETGENGGFDDLILDFDGGIYRSSRSGNVLWNLSWGGNISNNKKIAFDQLSLDLGMSANLMRRDWLPLTVAVVSETDRDFDAIDVSGELELAHILPFNIRLQSDAYRPALAPRLTARAAAGTAIQRDDPTAEENFVRAGYEILWRIPIQSSTHLGFHHAGTYNDVSGGDGHWHLLWDILIETKLGEVTYFVGYQQGQAAPLFEPTETTKIGLSIKTTRPSAR